LRIMQSRSALDFLPVLLSLADELGARFAVACDEAFDEPIDLGLESFGERNQGAEAACEVTWRGVPLVGEAEQEGLNCVALQPREPELKLVEGARPKPAEAREDLPFAGRRERSAVHPAESSRKRG
jgi:hypothetical protein